MARKTYPRKDAAHAVAASHVLARHSQRTGRAITLPVPIELIIERTFGIEILYDEIPESDETMVLGALLPSEKRIVLNTRHSAMFEKWIGPERFTLAHELAHWAYDADDLGQGTFDLGADHERFCYWRDTPGLSETLRTRETNANKLAAHLLLPDELVRAADLDEVLADFKGTAARWEVSQTMLRIKLETLGVLDDADLDQLALNLSLG